MIGLVVAFLLGAIVMDLMWAFKLGIPQALYYRWQHRNDPAPVYTWENHEEYVDEIH